MIYLNMNITPPPIGIHPKLGPAATHQGNGAKLLAYRSDIFFPFFVSVLVGVSAHVVQNELVAPNVRPARAHDTNANWVT